jgi:hypothetical protein
MRRRKHALYMSVPVWALAGVLIGAPAVAQVGVPDPPGPYAIDLRGVTSGLPVGAAFFPPAPSGTRIPTRGYGVDAGAHVYPLQLGPARLGVGVGLMRVRGAAPAVALSGSTSSSTTASTTPEVDSALTIIAPQLSFNFGSSAGWSYLSAGVGRARVRTETSDFRSDAAVPDVTAGAAANSGSRRSVNIGAGARWFAKAHLGVSFDVRLHMISAGDAEGSRPATPRSIVTAASVGISVR